jgi:hypothetical protein
MFVDVVDHAEYYTISAEYRVAVDAYYAVELGKSTQWKYPGCDEKKSSVPSPAGRCRMKLKSTRPVTGKPSRWI